MSDSDERMFSEVPWLKWILTPPLLFSELFMLTILVDGFNKVFAGELSIFAFLVIWAITLLVAWLIAAFWMPMDRLIQIRPFSQSTANNSNHPTVEFITTKFDVSAEKKNPINPIYGQSLLLWLRERSASRIEVAIPDYEDWGWFSYIEWNGRSYMVGASSDDGETWILQMEKLRTLSEKIFGRQKMSMNDEAWRYVVGLIESEPEFRDISSA